jgi:transcription antitermination factor NusG
MRWYAVMTKSRKESLAQQQLMAQGYATLFPHYRQWTTPKKTKPREVIKPYLTRYLFVGVREGQSFYTINNTIGVSTVVYCGYDALSIPESIIEEIRSRGDSDGRIWVKGDERPEFPGKPGDKVKFSEKSPLFGLLAEIKRVDNTGRLMVQLEQLLGSTREISVSQADVELVSTAIEPTSREDQLPGSGGSLPEGEE